MYEEKKWKKIDWKSFMLKGFIVILSLLVLMWLVPKLIPSEENKNNNNGKKESEKTPSYSFAENFASIHKTSINYFTIEKLPTNINETVTITLQNMLDSKIILKFTDENGNLCDSKKSYAEMTKNDTNEYTLKVQLTCKDETDHITEKYGVYNNCSATTCSSMLQILTKCELSCPDGFSINGSYCYKGNEKVKSTEICSTNEPIEDESTNISNTDIGDITTFDLIMYIFIIIGLIILTYEILLYIQQKKDRINYY